jgi:hypothetical protein
LMVKVTDLPVRLFVTRTLLPHGKDLCAAVIAPSLRDPPQATREPLLRS